FPNQSYFTYFGATNAFVSTLPDLLDQLDALVTGSLFATDRTPGPETLLGSRLHDGSVYGYGTPLNGYCPCRSAGGGNGIVPAAVGRRPFGLGAALLVQRYPDGIDVIVRFNS